MTGMPTKRWVGQPVPRQEDAELLAGHGHFIDDMELPGLAHAAYLRSPHGHARILRVDAARARAYPGSTRC